MIPQANINLFCIPFAGGAKHSFRGYQDHAPTYLNVEPVELPGRGSRVVEPLLSSVPEMTEDLFALLKDKLDTPYGLYGHSMGSLLVYTLTCKIIREGLPLPTHLFVSGAKAPMHARKHIIRSNMPDAEFIAELKALGGVPQAVIENQELMDFFLPILRADFKVLEEYEHQHCSPKMKLPVLAMTGSDENIKAQEVADWEQETEGKVTHEEYPGDHFFIQQHESQIITRIGQTLKSHVYTLA